MHSSDSVVILAFSRPPRQLWVASISLSRPLRSRRLDSYALWIWETDAAVVRRPARGFTNTADFF